MGRILFGLFLVVPMIEIALFIVLGNVFGLWLTLFGIIVTAMIGSFVIRRQGLSLLAEIQALTRAGTMPAKQVAEGVMLAIAGALLLTPGYFTDICGFTLLVPPFRTAIYDYVKSRITVQGFSTQAHTNTSNEGHHPRDSKIDDPDVIDLNADHWRDK